jgi:hypothetical protein
MKAIRYTRHAKNRMRWHRISEAEVESAMFSPDFAEPFSETRLNAWKRTSEKFLRVTYEEKNGELLVITAVKKNKGWG